MPQPKRIIIEGWRHSPTSYAVLNQFQLLELLKRPEIELYHRDLPYWLDNLKPVHGLFPPDDEAKINAILPPPPDLRADALLRIAHPTDVTRSSAARTCIWIATDFGILEASRIAHGLTPREALNQPGIDYMTCSKWSYDGLIRSGANPATLSIVPCGFDPALFRPLPDSERAALRKTLGWDGKFVFLHVSTLLWNKGTTLLFHAFASVLDRFPNAVLAIKGSNEWLKSDRRLQDTLAAMPPALAAKVQPRLAYAGDHLTHERLGILYNAADAYLAPYHAEGFCIPVLEAAACGLPVICSAGGSTDDFTNPSFARSIRTRVIEDPEVTRRHGQGARTLDVDMPHFIELMSAAITDPSFAVQARARGPAWVRERFTWKHVVDRLLHALLPDAYPSCGPYPFLPGSP